MAVLAGVVVMGAPAVANAAAGLAFYNASTGSYLTTLDPVLSGGDFDGLTVGALSIDDIAGMRDTNGNNLALLGPSGVHFYDVVGGGLASAHNPVLSGGDFDGQSISSLSISDMIGVRDTNGNNLILLGPSGVNFYDVVTGAFVGALDPTLSGGRFDGQSPSALPISVFAGGRDTNASNLVLFVTYSDTTFNDIDWGYSAYYTTGGAALAAIGQDGGTGNPAPSRYATVTLPGPGILVVGNYFGPAMVDPAALPGAITSLDFQFDYLSQVDDGASDYYSRIAPAVYQDGIFYTTGFPSMHTYWETGTWTSLTAANFVDIGGTLHPDFSAAGSPFYLGYSNYFSSGTFGGGWAQFVDNWSGTVNYAPYDPNSTPITFTGAGQHFGLTVSFDGTLEVSGNGIIRDVYPFGGDEDFGIPYQVLPVVVNTTSFISDPVGGATIGFDNVTLENMTLAALNVNFRNGADWSLAFQPIDIVVDFQHIGHQTLRFEISGAITQFDFRQDPGIVPATPVYWAPGTADTTVQGAITAAFQDVIFGMDIDLGEIADINEIDSAGLDLPGLMTLTPLGGEFPQDLLAAFDVDVPFTLNLPINVADTVIEDDPDYYVNITYALDGTLTLSNLAYHLEDVVEDAVTTWRTLTLTETNGGWGDVEIDPEPNDPNDIQFLDGTEVALTAVPIDGKAFSRWEIFDPNFPDDVNYATIDANLSTTIAMDTDMHVNAVWKCGSGAGPLLPVMLAVLALGALFVIRRRRTS